MEKPKKKRGRPKKSDQLDGAATGPTRPKRGRPRKKVEEPEPEPEPEPESGESEEEETENEENDTETGKRETPKLQLSIISH